MWTPIAPLINLPAPCPVLLAKGGKVSGVKSEQISETNIGVSGAYLGGGVERIKKVSTSHNVARAEDVAVGKLDQNEGTQGLVDKKQVAMAGIPSQTVVLGNYDARLVADILRQHLPQFRYCYQQELDRENKVSGKVELHFNIGASGRVTKAGVAKSALPGAVDGCVIDVLKAIRFLPPWGVGWWLSASPCTLLPAANKGVSASPLLL